MTIWSFFLQNRVFYVVEKCRGDPASECHPTGNRLWGTMNLAIICFMGKLCPREEGNATASAERNGRRESRIVAISTTIAPTPFCAETFPPDFLALASGGEVPAGLQETTPHCFPPHHPFVPAHQASGLDSRKASRSEVST